MRRDYTVLDSNERPNELNYLRPNPREVLEGGERLAIQMHNGFGLSAYVPNILKAGMEEISRWERHRNRIFALGRKYGVVFPKSGSATEACRITVEGKEDPDAAVMKFLTNFKRQIISDVALEFRVREVRGTFYVFGVRIIPPKRISRREMGRDPRKRR